MSSSGQTTTNSNTLLFRSNPAVAGINNMYALDKYNKPLPAGQVFVTSTNGIMNQETYYDGLKWSNYPAIHDVNMSGYNINNVSSISTSNFTTNSLNINVPSQTIQITNESCSFVIDEDVSEIYFEMIGAGGTTVTSDPNSGRGGNGGYMSGTILVNANGHNIVGQTLCIGAGKCKNNINCSAEIDDLSSSASYISINNGGANDVIIAIAGAGGNGGSVIGGSTTYQAEGGCGGGQQFNPFSDPNAGQISIGGNGTTNTGQSTVTAGGGATIYGGAGGILSGSDGYTHTGFLPVLGGLGAYSGSACGGSGGGGYSGGGGGGISINGTISSGGGGGSSYYSANYVNNISSNDGNHLSPGTLPLNGRAGQDGIVILTIYKQKAISTSGDIDCSGTITCNILKYSILDPPLYVSPQDAWSNFPAEGNINISNYDINNIQTANINTLNLSGGQYMFETIADNVTRPALNTPLNSYEIRAVSVNNTDTTNGKAGFLQLTAGGDADITNMTYIQLSGYSSVPDMNNNIVFGTAGGEKARITSSGNLGIGTQIPDATLDVSGSTIIRGTTTLNSVVANGLITANNNVNVINTLSISSAIGGNDGDSQLLLFNGKTRFATNNIYDGCFIEMANNQPLYITNMGNNITYAEIGINSSQFNGGVNITGTLTASTINTPNIISTNNATVSNILNVMGQLDASNIQMYSGTIHAVGTIDMSNGVINGVSTINMNYATVNNKLIVNGPIEAGNINCSTLTYTSLSPNVVTGVTPGDGITISGTQSGSKYIGDITIYATPNVYQEEYRFIYSDTVIQYSDINQYAFLDYLIVGGGGGGAGGVSGSGVPNYGGGGGGSGYIRSSFYIPSYKILTDTSSIYRYVFNQTENNTISITNDTINIIIGGGGNGGGGDSNGSTGGVTTISIGSSPPLAIAEGGIGGQPYGSCNGGAGFNGGGGGCGGSTAGGGGASQGTIALYSVGGTNGNGAPSYQQSGSGGGFGAGNGQVCGSGSGANSGGGGAAGSCVTRMDSNQTGGNGGVNSSAGTNGLINTGAGGGGGTYKDGNYGNGGNGGSGYAILWFHT